MEEQDIKESQDTDVNTTQRNAEIIDEKYDDFLRNVNQAMGFCTVVGGIAIGTQSSMQNSYAYISSCLLMWVNVYFLVMSIYGILKKIKKMAVLLIGQSFLLFGGLFGLVYFFKDEMLWLLLGCSTWLVALFWGKIKDKNQEAFPENT
jgi:hypothetical protein